MNEFKDIDFLIERSRFKLAISKLNERLPQYLNNERIYYSLSFCYYKLNEDTKAEIAIKKGLQINPNSSDLLFQYALLELKKGNGSKGKKYLESSLATNPNDERVFVLKSRIYFKNNDFKNAIFYSKKALNINPNSSFPKNIIALNYLLKKKNVEAKELLNQILNTDPHNAFGLTNLALLKIDEDKSEESVAILKNLISKYPNDNRIIRSLKFAIISKNKIALYLIKMNVFIQNNSFIINILSIVSILLILTTVISSIIIKLEFNIDLITSTILFFFLFLNFRYKIAPQLSRLALLQDRLGKIFLENNDRILLLFSLFLFIISALFFLLIISPPFHLTHFQIITISLALNYASSIPCDISIVPKNDSKIILIILNIIFIAAIFYFIKIHDLRFQLSIFILIYAIIYPFLLSPLLIPKIKQKKQLKGCSCDLCHIN